MLFSKSLAVLSTLAFGALSALAAPVTPVEHALVARCDCTSIPDIFVGIQADISVHIDALSKCCVLLCLWRETYPALSQLTSPRTTALRRLSRPSLRISRSSSRMLSSRSRPLLARILMSSSALASTSRSLLRLSLTSFSCVPVVLAVVLVH